MDDGPQSARLRELLRANQPKILAKRGRRDTEEWLPVIRQALETVLGQSLPADDFLSSDAAWELYERVRQRIRNREGTREDVWFPDDSESPWVDLAAIPDAVGSMTATLFLPLGGQLLFNDDESVSAVHVPASLVLWRARAVWPVVKETLVMVSDSLESGLDLDVMTTYEPERGVHDRFEMTSWGLLRPPR